MDLTADDGLVVDVYPAVDAPDMGDPDYIPPVSVPTADPPLP